MVKSVVSQAVETIRETALKNGIVNQDVLTKLDKIAQTNLEYSSSLKDADASRQRSGAAGPQAFERSMEQARKQFGEAIKQAGDLTDEEKFQAGIFLAFQSSGLSAVANYERARSTPPVKEKIKAYIKDGLNKDHEGFIERTHETLEKMIISTVFTMHPTIYHTPFARKLETDLTSRLEQLIDKDNEHKSFDAHTVAASNEIREGAFKTILDEAAKQLKAGTADLTPMKKVTVPEENETEKEIIATMIETAASLTRSWNESMHELSSEGHLSESERDKLLISEKTQKRLFEFRTWGRESDADGRLASTSLGFYQWIKDEVVNDEFKGFTRDMRDNSQQIIDVTSAMVQTNFQRSRDGDFGVSREFYNYCHEFVETAQKQNGWKDADHSLLQQLAPESQAKFLRELIVKESESSTEEQFRLIPEELHRRTLEFCKHYTETLAAFKHENNLPENLTFEQMAGMPATRTGRRNLQAQFQDTIQEKTFYTEEDGKGDAYHYHINQEGFYQATIHDKAYNILEGRRLITKDGTIKIMDEKERRQLMDVPKRLIVAEHAIRHYARDKTPENVATNNVVNRYQISNFENSAHFYALMLLMQQTGVMDIKEGKVNSSKIAIQPLIETAQDRKNAPGVFAELLKDPLARSYFETIAKDKGYVELMVGFSDGAATGGNFASEWDIYKCTKELTDLFEKEAGIKVRFFQGRGRGDDRGGQHEPGLDLVPLPDKVADLAILDVTRQSDEPQAGAISPALRKEQAGSAMLGVLAKRERVLTRTEAEKTQIESFERAFNFIADRAEHHFNEIVREREDGEAYKMYNAMPGNPDISSRGKSKSNAFDGKQLTAEQTTTALDSTRAIGKEYSFRLSGLAAYDAALKLALEEYIAKSATDDTIQVLGKDGKPQTGLEALRTAYNDFDALQALLDKTYFNIRKSYEPIRAEAYGRVTGTEHYVKDANAGTDGLMTLLEHIQAPTRQFIPKSESGRLMKLRKEPMTHTEKTLVGGVNINPALGAMYHTSQVAHSLMLSIPPSDWNIKTVDGKLPEKGHTVRNLLDVAAVGGIQANHYSNDTYLQQGAVAVR